MKRITGFSKYRCVNYLNTSFFKNTYYLMANRILSLGSGFVFWMMVARYYSIEDTGIAAAAISAMNLIVLLSSLGFGFGIIAYLPTEKNKAGLINSCYTITAILALILSLIYIFSIDYLTYELIELKSNQIFSFFFILSVISTAYFTLNINLFVAFRKAKYALLQNIISTIRLIIVPFLIELRVFGIFISFNAGLIISLVTSLILIKKTLPKYKPSIIIKKNIMERIILFSSANYVSELLKGLPGLILPLFIISKMGAESSAFFFVAWSVSSILLMIPESICLSLFSESSYDSKFFKINYFVCFKQLFILLISALLILILVGKPILTLFGETYAEKSYFILLILSIASIPIGFNSLFITEKRVEKKVGSIISIYLFIVVGTMIGSYLSIDMFGLNGIGFSWIVSNSIISIVAWKHYKKFNI